MTRPSATGWVLLLWSLLWLWDRDRRRGSIRLAIYVGTFVALMLPWGLRNRAAVGSFAWLSTNGGVTLYDAIGPQARGNSDQSFLETLPGLANLDEVERDRRLRDLALAELNDVPRLVRLAGVKFARTWSFTPNDAKYRASATDLASAAFMIVVLVGAAIGVWRTRRLTKLHWLLWLPVVYFTLVHCVFIGSLRYRVPLMPYLEIMAAAALVLPSLTSRAQSAERASDKL